MAEGRVERIHGLVQPVPGGLLRGGEEVGRVAAQGEEFHERDGHLGGAGPFSGAGFRGGRRLWRA